MRKGIKFSALAIVLAVLLFGCGISPDTAAEADITPDETLAQVEVVDEAADETEVNEEKTTVVLNKKKLSLKTGKTFQLKAMGASAADVEWSSSNNKVASVTEQGVVKGKKKGTAKITAKVYGEKYTCKVTVTPDKKSNNNTKTKYSFRNPSYLTEHYKKHGIEMGFESEDAYLAAANKVIANPNTLHKLEAEDDDHVYYIESTNEIVFLSQDGYIRTYFICGGRYYFDKQ